MPTAPKLVAAIIFGFVAWFAASLIIPYLPPGTRIAWVPEGSAAIGVLMGWFTSGAKAGAGIGSGLGYGLTTVALIVFWGLFVFAGEEMLDRSLNVRYDGPIQAISDMIMLMLGYGQVMAKPDVIVWLLLGAVFGGVVTELSARRWS